MRTQIKDPNAKFVVGKYSTGVLLSEWEDSAGAVAHRFLIEGGWEGSRPCPYAVYTREEWEGGLKGMTSHDLKGLSISAADVEINKALALCGPIPDGYEIDGFQDNDWGWISEDSEAWGFPSLEDAVNAARVHALRGAS